MSVFLGWVAIMALIPVAACACASPVDLRVLNYSQRDASVSWNQPGMFGTFLRGLSGGEPAPRCQTTLAGLRSGLVSVTVSIGDTSRTFGIHVRDAQVTGQVIVIRSDGTIADPVKDPPADWKWDDPKLC